MSDEYDLDEADGRCEECGSLDGLHLVECSRAPSDEDDENADDEPEWDAEQEYRRADQIRQEDEMNERWELEQELDHDDCPECLGSGRDGGSSAPCPACFKPRK